MSGVLAVGARAAMRQPLAHAEGSEMSYDPVPGTTGATVRTAWLWFGSVKLTARCTGWRGCLIRSTCSRSRVPVTVTGAARPPARRCSTDGSGADELPGTHAPTDAKRAVSTAISGGSWSTLRVRHRHRVPTRVGPIDRCPQIVDAGARPDKQHGVGTGRVQSAQRAVVARVSPGGDRERSDGHGHRDQQHRAGLGRAAQQLADGEERREPSRVARPPRQPPGEERQQPQRHDSRGDGQQRRGQHR